MVRTVLAFGMAGLGALLGALGLLFLVGADGVTSRYVVPVPG